MQVVQLNRQPVELRMPACSLANSPCPLHSLTLQTLSLLERTRRMLHCWWWGTLLGELIGLPFSSTHLGLTYCVP